MMTYDLPGVERAADTAAPRGGGRRRTMADSPLLIRIKQDTIAAMKAGEKQRVRVLRMLQSSIKQVEVDTRSELDDAAVVRILRSYAKKVRDALASARSAGREDLVDEAERELALVESYLPAELDDAALEKILREVVAEVGATSPRDMGKVMKAAMARLEGQAEGGRVSAMVRSLLAGG